MHSSSTPEAAVAETIDSDGFRRVIGHFGTGVGLITSRFEGNDFGMTASAVTFLGGEDPAVVVCLNKSSSTQQAIFDAGRFVVHIAREDQADLAAHFAKPNTGDKFADLNVERTQTGLPVLQNCLVAASCRTEKVIESSTHRVFIGRMEERWQMSGSPLAYYRGRLGRFESFADKNIYSMVRTLIYGRPASAPSLSVQEIADELVLPEAAARYACGRLLEEGYVDRDASGGYVLRVADPLISDEAFDAKCFIELASAIRAVDIVDDDQVNALERIHHEMVDRLSGSGSDLERYNELNARFHEFAVALAQNDHLVDAYRRVSIPGFMLEAMPRPESIEAMLTDHAQLVDAYRRRDLEGIMSISRRHADRAKTVHQNAIASRIHPVGDCAPSC